MIDFDAASGEAASPTVPLTILTGFLGADLLGRDLGKRILDLAPPRLADLLNRAAILPQFNTIVSNVRGPKAPAYLAGAQMKRFYSVSLPVDYAGLNHTAISFGDTFWVGVISCREMLPDPALYIQCFRESFNETLLAAGLPAVTAPEFTNALPAVIPVPTKAKRKAALFGSE